MTLLPCVGPAHVFVSHAWQYRFADLVAALEGLVARADNAFTADGTYFWLDCVVIDEHDTAALCLQLLLRLRLRRAGLS